MVRFKEYTTYHVRGSDQRAVREVTAGGQRDLPLGGVDANDAARQVGDQVPLLIDREELLADAVTDQRPPGSAHGRVLMIGHECLPDLEGRQFVPVSDCLQCLSVWIALVDNDVGKLQGRVELG